VKEPSDADCGMPSGVAVANVSFARFSIRNGESAAIVKLRTNTGSRALPARSVMPLLAVSR
jgi:hypothetical protein